MDNDIQWEMLTQIQKEKVENYFEGLKDVMAQVPTVKELWDELPEDEKLELLEVL